MNLFSIRRERLIKDIAGNGAIILFSGNEIMKSEDEAYPFDVNRNFYYLTGLEKESMALVISIIDGKVDERLFILPYDELLAKWVGGRISKGGASEISGVENILDYGELDNYLVNLLNRQRHNQNYKLYFDLWHYSTNQEASPAIKMANKYKSNYPALDIMDIYPLISRMRLVKDGFELACIKAAIDITNSGVRQMMSSIKPGYNEMMMEGIFNFALAQKTCNKTAFKSICASGKRATVLHYSDNNQVMEDGELFLCDLGATYKNYCADISRTFPVNGKFTDRQKEIYEVVLGAQKVVEDNAKPGVKLRELNNAVIEYYKRELPKHGLNKDVGEYYFHGVSHHLGLDTHDVDMGNIGLAPGNVITNEPGLYIEDENIGIRIEDDLLITGTGNEVLSSAIPKTIEEIEALRH